MTKKEIVKQISEELDLTQLKVKEIVQKTFESIIDTLVEDDKHRIELRNFGVFEVKKRAARKARNPRTGERVDVAAKYVVTFKPGKEMEERVRELEEREARKAQEALAAESASTSQPTTPAPSPETTTGYGNHNPVTPVAESQPASSPQPPTPAPGNTSAYPTNNPSSQPRYVSEGQN